MARQIRRPVADAVGLQALAELLRLYASGTAPADQLQTEVFDGLRATDPSRAVSAQLVQNYDRVPGELKSRFLGQVDAASALRRFTNRAQGGGLAVDDVIFKIDDVSLGEAPEYPSDTQFTILYTGLYCRERTGDRGIFGPSDETYLITSTVQALPSENLIRTVNHPVGDPDQRYGDVDSGEHRTGPEASIWSGGVPAAGLPVSIVTTVMEQDEGDPDAYRQQIEAIVGLGAAAAQAKGISIPEELQEVVVDLIGWILDPADDQIGTAVLALDDQWIRRWPALPTRPFKGQRIVPKQVGLFQFEEELVIDQTDIEHHFASVHTEDGKYSVLYRMVADKAPIADPDPDGIRVVSERFAGSTLFAGNLSSPI